MINWSFDSTFYENLLELNIYKIFLFGTLVVIFLRIYEITKTYYSILLILKIDVINK